MVRRNYTVPIWNSDWLNADFQKLPNETSIIDEQIIEQIEKVIASKEVEIFKTDYQDEQEQ